MLEKRYFEIVQDVLQNAVLRNAQALEQAAAMVASAYAVGGMFHAFGTGHSHMLALELFYRAGGLVKVNPILDETYMLHNTATKSTQAERLPGYAAVALGRHAIGAQDVVIIFSNSGINAAPVEAALYAREKKAGVIALTNLAQSQASQPRHPSGQRLFELADVVLDNCCPNGDACIDIPGKQGRIAPVSTIAGACLCNMLMVRVVEWGLAQGTDIPTFSSSNVPGGDQVNHRLIAQMQGLIPAL